MRSVRTRSAPYTGSEQHAPAHNGEGTSQELAWAVQWHRHQGDVVRYVTYLLAGDTHAAEDVAQETALRLWQHPEVLSDDEPLAGWLRTVARNIVIDRVRRRRARPTEVALSPSVDRAGTDTGGGIEEASSVATILAGLSARHRDVVLEVYVRDRPVADVAADLGIPTGTVKSRCHTAIHQLRDSWGDAVATCA